MNKLSIEPAVCLCAEDFNNLLVGVIMRFRQKQIPLMADVEVMFHHLKVDPHNVDALRLLWYPDGDLNKEPEEFLKW